MTANREPIRPGQRYAECDECGVFARGGSRRIVLKHMPGCSKAPTPPADDEAPGPTSE